MTQKEKILLLKDLCARVPYRPKGLVVNACNGAESEEWLTYATFTMFTSVTNNCRLYLRPMSSMTEEEKKKYYETMDEYTHRLYPYSCDWSEHTEYSWTIKTFDYLNSIHVDYRGLIPKDLAIKVTEDNNPYKK